MGEAALGISFPLEISKRRLACDEPLRRALHSPEPRSMVMKVSPKKKSTSRSRGSGTRAFAVVLEDLHAKFDVFGEALQGVRNDVADLKGDVAELKGAVAELKGAVASLQLLRPELAALREDVRVLRDDMGVLRHDVELLKIATIDNAREIQQLRKVQ